MNLLKTNLKLLVKSNVLGNSTLVNAEEAKYILDKIEPLTIDKCIEHLCKHEDEITVEQHEKLMSSFVGSFFDT